jgi:hypothetical protein
MPCGLMKNELVLQRTCHPVFRIEEQAKQETSMKQAKEK